MGILRSTVKGRRLPQVSFVKIMNLYVGGVINSYWLGFTPVWTENY